MPIVDDAKTFGHIAAVNAISDIYAMGGKPLLAIAILGWPIDKLPPEVANGVVEGAREACAKAGIPLAGGHSIDSPEPIFGLAVTGRVDVKNLKRNGGAQEGDTLFLTKPLGIGIYSTAQKKGLITDEHHRNACTVMMQLNQIGETLAQFKGVHAMTDVTGFGLAGHLLEMCDASDACAVLDESAIPLLDAEAINTYLTQGCVPGGTHRNFKSYGHRLPVLTEGQKYLLCDPQTSGGLLIAAAPEISGDITSILRESGLHSESIGVIAKEKDPGPRIALK